LQNANGPDEAATSVRAGSHQLEIGNMNSTKDSTGLASLPARIDGRSDLTKYVEDVKAIARMASINFGSIERAFAWDRGRLGDHGIYTFKFSDSWVQELIFLASNLDDR